MLGHEKGHLEPVSSCRVEFGTCCESVARGEVVGGHLLGVDRPVADRILSDVHLWACQVRIACAARSSHIIVRIQMYPKLVCEVAIRPLPCQFSPKPGSRTGCQVLHRRKRIEYRHWWGVSLIVPRSLSKKSKNGCGLSRRCEVKSCHCYSVPDR